MAIFQRRSFCRFPVHRERAIFGSRRLNKRGFSVLVVALCCLLAQRGRKYSVAANLKKVHSLPPSAAFDLRSCPKSLPSLCFLPVRKMHPLPLAAFVGYKRRVAFSPGFVSCGRRKGGWGEEAVSRPTAQHALERNKRVSTPHCSHSG